MKIFARRWLATSREGNPTIAAGGRDEPVLTQTAYIANAD